MGRTFQQVAVEVHRAQVELHEEAHFPSPEWQHFAVRSLVLTAHQTMANRSVVDRLRCTVLSLIGIVDRDQYKCAKDAVALWLTFDRLFRGGSKQSLAAICLGSIVGFRLENSVAN